MSNKDLYPKGGGIIKNAVAASLVKHGISKYRADEDWEKINVRVPPRGLKDNYNDSFVFQGSDNSGNMFMSRLGLREDGSIREVWVFLDIDGEKFTNEPILINGENPADETIAAGGLSYTYIDDGCWKIEFEGLLNGNVKGKIDLTYIPSSKIYLSSIHMDPRSTGRAMAEMPWSRDYFDKLRSERQVRFEEGGYLEGTILFGEKSFTSRLKAFRDHSFGKREWAFINRYIWNIFSLENPVSLGGDEFEYICYTTVDYGTTFKHLVSGWIAGKNSILPIVASSNMHELASDRVVPGVYDIVFVPRGKSAVTAKVFRSGTPHIWSMQNGSFIVNEAYCKIEINGITGQGMSEFGYSITD
ncbi:MAG: hypothetical protein JXR91_00900 [Deltaproteobacteria bacterium]|nr:hypothetical protein [Deltaproteobacteria bacterium]